MKTLLICVIAEMKHMLSSLYYTGMLLAPPGGVKLEAHVICTAPGGVN